MGIDTPKPYLHELSARILGELEAGTITLEDLAPWWRPPCSYGPHQVSLASSAARSRKAPTPQSTSSRVGISG